MAFTEDEQRHLAAAIHEAAHSVVAAVHGATVDYAEVIQGA